MFAHTDANAVVVPTVDSRRGSTQPLDDAEVRARSEQRQQAYLAFIAELEASSPEVEICEDTDDAGIA